MSAGIDRARWWALAAILFGGLLAGYAACLWSSTEAYPHDVYKGVYGRKGNLCCGGDPQAGDCEALNWDQIHTDRGVTIIDSKRYGHPVLVPEDRIVWGGIPGEVPGTAGHWCGIPRVAGATSPDQPDPSFLTFCAFIAPGGV